MSRLPAIIPATATYPKRYDAVETNWFNPHKRTIIAAMYPQRYHDSYTEIYLKVWFEELPGPIGFVASPLDCERHGKELWFRAMAGEYGLIQVVPLDAPAPLRPLPETAMKLVEQVTQPPKMLEYHGQP